MAIKNLVSGAWQEVDTLKVPVSGAYQDADHANALVSGAWQEVWSNGTYFLENGVLANGATKTAYGTIENGYLICTSTGDRQMYLNLPITSEMLGKKLVFSVRNSAKAILNLTYYITSSSVRQSTDMFTATPSDTYVLYSWTIPTNFKTSEKATFRCTSDAYVYIDNIYVK